MSMENIHFEQESGMERKYLNTQQFPLVISKSSQGSASDLSPWIVQNKSSFEADLNKNGAILFRGFGIDSLEKFNSFMQAFDTAPLPYMFRSSPRKEISKEIKNIYHSTTYPNHQSIHLHNESSYSRVYGMKIIFCCIIPAVEGGETPIADSRKVLNDINEELLLKFRKHGIKYTRHLFPHLGLSWQEVFQTENSNEMDRICKKYNIEYHFSEDDNDVVTISWIKPAIANHPLTGEETWFNHTVLFSKFSLLEITGLSEQDELPEDLITQDTCFGNGEPISFVEYSHLKQAYQRNSVIFPYEKGDVLILDNMLAAHGRMPFKGERLIATSLIEPRFDKGYEEQ